MASLSGKHEDISEHSETESSEEEEIGEEEIADTLRNLQPYQYEPRKHDNDSSSSSESDLDSSNILPDDLSETCADEDDRELNRRRGDKDWCKCGCCKKENREIDCFSCQEVYAISEDKFENHNCITLATEFKALRLAKFVLKNVFVGLHKARGDPLEKESELTNRPLRFAAYKQFIWWIFQRLGKGNRRVIPSCVVWNIRKLYPEANGNLFFLTKENLTSLFSFDFATVQDTYTKRTNKIKCKLFTKISISVF